MGELQPHIRRLQIMYKCMNLSMQRDNAARVAFVKEGGDAKQSYNVIPQFQRTWLKLLTEPEQFGTLKATQQELAHISKEIQTLDNITFEEVDKDAGEDEDEDEDALS